MTRKKYHVMCFIIKRFFINDKNPKLLSELFSKTYFSTSTIPSHSGDSLELTNHKFAKRNLFSYIIQACCGDSKELSQ